MAPVSRRRQVDRAVWACTCGMLWPVPPPGPQREELWSRWQQHHTGPAHRPCTASEARAVRQERKGDAA